MESWLKAQNREPLKKEPRIGELKSAVGDRKTLCFNIGKAALDFILFYFIWNTSCSQDNTRKSYNDLFPVWSMMTCGGF